MIKNLKLTSLASLVAAASLNGQAATTNLLQSVNVAFTVFTQGTPVVTSSGTNNVVNRAAFNSRDLIRAVSASSNFNSGDVLVRATPVVTASVLVTNLTPASTNTLVITNTSTSNTNITYDFIFDGTNIGSIGDTNVIFGTNVEVIGGSTVTLGLNTAVAGTNTTISANLGSNTTVTATVLTNFIGENVGTNYVFVGNTLTTATSGTNVLGTAAFFIYNPKDHGTLTPISTNVLFNIFTDHVHDDGTNVARIHGEFVKRDGVIKFGTTDEIRTFVLSNSAWNIKLKGYAAGHYVPISLGGNDDVTSQDFNWIGSGSGLTAGNIVVMDGGISESYFKTLK